MPETILRNFIFTELSADVLTAGHAFDGLAVGEFVDMHGQKVRFKPDELAEYVANTLAAIAATRAESGELAGLPIDANNHDKGDGAGYIVNVEQQGDLIRVFPTWTEIGVELIGKKIRRWFSATVDTAHKVILGGTLTNWPATRDRVSGKMLLRPIELSEARQVYQLADESLDEKTSKVRSAFYAATEKPAIWEPMVCEVFDDYVVVMAGESYYKVEYTTDADGNIAFAPRDEWVEVKQSYVEAAWNFFLSLFPKSKTRTAPTASAAATAPTGGEQPPSITGDENMPIKLSDLSEADRKQLLTELAAQLGLQPQTGAEAPSSPANNFDPVAFLQMEGVEEKVVKEFEQKLLAGYEVMQAKAATKATEMIAKLRREKDTAELCNRVVSGTPDVPRGLRGVTTEDLSKHLLALPFDEAQWWSQTLELQLKDGFISYQELGHGKGVQGVQELPAEIAAKLDEGKFKLADLSNPILGLGDLKQYNLAKWSGK